jgi:hypothetical protein
MAELENRYCRLQFLIQKSSKVKGLKIQFPKCEIHTVVYLENSVSPHAENLDTSGRIILKWILENLCVSVGWIRLVQNGFFCWLLRTLAFEFHKRRENVCVDERWSSCQKGICTSE